MISKFFKPYLFRSASKFTPNGFCTTQQSTLGIQYKVKDVTRLRGSDTDTRYFFIQNTKIQLPNRKLIAHVTVDNPLSKSNNEQPLLFLSKDLKMYHPGFILEAITDESFYIQFKGKLYYILNNQPLVKKPKHPEYAATMAPASLQLIVRKCLRSLNKLQTISGKNIQNMLMTYMLKNSLPFKIQKIQLKELLKVVNKKIQSYQAQIDEQMVKIKQVSNRRVKMFSSVILMQYAFIHYLVYYHLSWDIMEPITCIVANTDLLIAYLFFLTNKRSYSLQQIQNNIIEKRKIKYLKKNGVDYDKYLDLLQIRNYLQFRHNLLSRDPFIVMDTLRGDRKIQLLDDR